MRSNFKYVWWRIVLQRQVLLEDIDGEQSRPLVTKWYDWMIMVKKSMMKMIRRALTTVQIFFDQSGNLMATNRSRAKATIILKIMMKERQTNTGSHHSFSPTLELTKNSSNKIYILYNYRVYTRKQYVEWEEIYIRLDVGHPMLSILREKKSQHDLCSLKDCHTTFGEYCTGINDGKSN